MTILYRLENVSRSYLNRTVLNIRNLDIEREEIFALIGPSGAGKSTLLRLLALLEAPSAGTLTYAGQPVGKSMPVSARRDVTMMFQHPLLLDRSVQSNVEYGLRVRGIRDDTLVARLLEEVGLTHLRSARSRTLSGGEQQRVALARALIFNPKVLLLDEPTAHLDPRNVAIIEEVISRRHRELGMSVILATHNLHQASRLAARVAMLLDGEIIEIGPANCLLEQAADPRTRAFLAGGMVH